MVLGVDDVMMTKADVRFAGADVKQLHAAHIDEVAKVMTATSMTDPRYVYCLPGKVSGTVDAELCLYTATQLVKFAFESHGSVWGHLKVSFSFDDVIMAVDDVIGVGWDHTGSRGTETPI